MNSRELESSDSRRIPEISIVESPCSLMHDKFYGVKDTTGSEIGRFSLIYQPRPLTYELGSTSVVPSLRGKGLGYGRAILLKAGKLNEHEGQRYRFISPDMMSLEMIKTWESLVRDGLAREIGDLRFEMIDSDDAQKND